MFQPLKSHGRRPSRLALTAICVSAWLVAAGVTGATTYDGESEESRTDQQATEEATSSDQRADEEQQQATGQQDETPQAPAQGDETQQGTAPPVIEAGEVGGDASVPRPLKPIKIPTKIDPKTGQEVLVLTNEGLVSVFGPPKEQPPASVPYEIAGESAAEAAEDLPPDADAEQRIAQIKDDLGRMRKNLLRLRNPLLARPELTPEEAADQEGRDNVARIEMTEERIRDLEAELQQLLSESPGSASADSGS